MKSKSAEEIAKEILYLPVTNGKSESSTAKGAELIKAYASQSKWVSVEDGLPPVGKVVLLWHAAQLVQITGFYNGSGFAFVQAHLHCPQPNGNYDSSRYLVDVLPNRITHWKQLSENPK